LEAWKEVESTARAAGVAEADPAQVDAKWPRKVKMRRTKTSDMPGKLAHHKGLHNAGGIVISIFVWYCRGHA
jgi:hypothetical protein